MLGLIKLLVGAAAIIALGALAIMVEGMPGSAISAEARLQESVDTSLSANGVDWASVSVDGQKAVITGAAPSEDAFKLAYDAIAKSAGAGGLLLGGVTIIDQTRLTVNTLPPVADPFLWIAERQGDSLILSGSVPSESDKTELLSYAQLRFPEAAIADTMEIARGAPSKDYWLSAAALSLDALARLTNGAVEANDAQFILTGETEDPAASRNVALLMSALPDQFTGDADIRYTGQTIGETNTDAMSTVIIDAEPPAEEPNEASAVETCRTRLTEAIASQAISFASSSRQLNDESSDGLQRLADAMLNCPQFNLEITGHTDSTGERARNLRLSENRAVSVAIALASLGVDAGHLEANGRGDAEPLFSNDTLEGRAGNRRIEFTISIPTQPESE